MNNRYKKYINMSLTFAILDPKGPIAHQERSLIITAVLLMLIIVLPVFVMTAVIAWKYRAGNKSAKHTPNWDHNLKTGIIFWVIPSIIIAIMAVINWNSTHQLDPYKPLASNVKPITIQVVALRWKWLFIYPDQNIATVNFVQFPNSTPVNFELTSDAPMSSFWIPQLGGQMYAMAGMQTQLHLEATVRGEFNGSAAEINGAGFAGMKFVAKASTNADFDSWIQSVKSSPTSLSLAEFNKLAEPSTNNEPVYYSSTDKSLYNNIIMKFMMPSEGIQ